MTTLTDAAHLRLAVLEHPHDDAPRLQLADCLDDSGEGERAAFIRAQIALASPDCPQPKCVPPKSDYVFGLGAYTHHCRCAYCKLRRREWRAWRRKGCDWQAEFFQLVAEPEIAHALRTGEPVRRLPENYSGPRCEFRRGFIESVTLPTTLFIGGVCERCEGEGGWNLEIAYGTERETCPACHGSGRTVGIAGPLFAAHPITAVTLSGREPFPLDPGFGWACRNARHAWPHDWERSGPENCRLPEVLFFEMGGLVDGYGLMFETRDLALAALSRAAVALGRAAATGCEHEAVCETCERTGKVKPYSVSYRTSVKKGSRWGTDLCPDCDGTGRVVRGGLPPLVNHKGTSEAP